MRNKYFIRNKVLMDSLKFTLLVFLTISAAFLFVFISFLTTLSKDYELTESYNWIVRLSLNIFSYLSIIIPGWFFYHIVKKLKYRDYLKNNCILNIFNFCFEYTYEECPTKEIIETESDSVYIRIYENNINIFKPKWLSNDSFILILCACGLQVFYLIWGILQEKIITQKYISNLGSEEHFTDSQFLVFVNRILAFIISGIYLLFTNGLYTKNNMPFYKYVYCSLSNILSSWCQYEALKFVSFPTQVLAKATKIIPIMIMNKVISRTKFEKYEYYTAIIMSLGMVMFLLEAVDDKKHNTVTTTFTGVVLLILYLIFDSFTSNWQGELFKSYKITSIQMIFGVNLFSSAFTLISLIQNGDLYTSLEFMFKYPTFMCDCILLSICSAFGQLLIYFTISKFGAVTFVIIMTIRQGLAILLSCLIYNHNLNVVGIFGVVLVFLSIFIRIYCKQRKKYLQSIIKT